MDSDADESVLCTPPEIKLKAKHFFNKAYENFMDWRCRQNTKSFSENI